MEEYTPNKNNKTEDIRIVTDFKDELERIKQKLASDFSKYSEMEKMKNKQRTNNQRELMLNSKNTELKLKETNELNKLPTLEELKKKYGIIQNKKISSENQTNFSTTFNQNSNSNSNSIINSNNNIQTNNQYSFMTKIDIKKKNNADNKRINKVGSNNIDIIDNRNNYINTTFNNKNILECNELRRKYVELDSEDRNNFTFKNNNIQKIPILKIDSINIDNMNYNYMNREQRRIESPLSNRANNISNNNTSILLNSKLDQQIKLINEKSENNRLEEEKTQMKIREIENQLQLDERLTHNNREIRKNALKELSDMCQKDFNTTEDKQKAFDYFSPWIKYCLEETNSYVIPECLNFFIIFNALFPHFLNVSIKDFFDNVERFISFGISSINESCIKIFIMFFNDKKLYNLTFNELIKLLVKASSSKTNKFLQEIIFILLKKDIFQENYIKILFEKILHIYINSNKNNDKKKIFTQIIKNVYYYIEDDYQTIKKNVKLKSSKDLDNVFNKIYSSPDFKKNSITYTLYPRPIQTDIEINSNMDYFNSSIGDASDRQLSERRNNNYKSIYEKGNLNQEKKNNYLQIGPNGEVNDIISVLPNEFFEYHFVVQFQQKMKILENSNEILNKIKFVKDKNKNLVDVYKTINYSIEDSNILIHLEGIKMLENICKLINQNINAQKLKLILETCFTKLKDKKSIIKNELFNLFNIVIEYQCFEISKFISFILNYCSNDKNDNSIIKQGLLEYIKSLFLQENRNVQLQIDNISEKEFLNYTKKVINIIEKESISIIKDLCSDLLIILKRKINSQRTFYDLIESLPNYRKKMIQTEEKNEMNESSYRKNLRQIKSSYSFSNFKKRNRNTKSLNNLNYSINSNSNSNMNSIGNDSISSSNNGTFNKFKKINVRSNHYSKNNIRKINKKKLNISFSNSPPRQDRNKNYKNVNVNDIDEKIVNKTEIRDDNHKKYEKINSINNNNNKTINKENSMDSLEQKKLSLLKSIDNINEETIEKYSKIIIKDFFVFIKKICQHKTDDLATHFELIFMIYEKIFNRIIIILKENKDKNKHQNVAKFIKLIDELMNLLTKVIILTPGIQQIKGSSKFNIIKFEKYLCIFSNYCFNKEKYYIHLLLNLYKLCEGGDDDFPPKFDPKYSTIFFLNYIKKANNEINSKKILNILKQFIAETNVLSLSEKNDLLEGIELNSDNEIDVSFGNKYINTNANNKNEEDEECNIIKDKDNNKNKNNIDKKNSLDGTDTHILDLPLKIENSKLKKNELNDIEKSIKLMSNRLSLNKFPTQENINRNIDEKKRSNSNNNEIIKENNNDSKSKNKVVDNNEIKKNMNSLNIPISVIRNKLTLNNKEKLLLKIHSTNRSPPNILKKNNENTNPKLNNKNNNINTLNSVNIIPQTNKLKTNTNTNDNNSKVYIQTINQIIKILRNESTDEGIFNLAISQFLKLSSVEQKSEFINYLNNSLKNPIFFKNISINLLLNFYDFILSLLSFEILKFPNEESNISTLQLLAQNLLDYCKLNDIFKVLLFLLKKYFPKDLNKKIADISLVMIKIIAYFLKELLKNLNKGKINGRAIICEINDLFTNTPPSNLTTLTPNCSFYQNIFTLLKTITDQIISQDKKELSGIIKYLQEKKIVCEDYMQYLIRLNNSFYK